MSETENDVAVVEDNKPVTVELYDANHGLLPRSGGPYLDDLEKEAAEVQRAKVEGREPDLENPGAVAGTHLVPRAYLKERDTDHSHEALADNVELVNEPVASYEVAVEDNEPDPSQVNWDNDHQRVNAMQAQAAYVKAEQEANVPDPEPVEEEKPVYDV